MDFDLSGLNETDRLAAFAFLRNVSFALDCGMCPNKDFTDKEEKELEEVAELFVQSMLASSVAHESIRLLKLFLDNAVHLLPESLAVHQSEHAVKH
jgi:hypothetical protein